MRQRDDTDIGIWQTSVFRGIGIIDLAFRQQLRMDFKSNNGGIFISYRFIHNSSNNSSNPLTLP
jgi:hypothetical protein